MDTSKDLFFSDKWKSIIKSGGKSFKLNFSDLQLDLFATHAAHLTMWNKTINLTSINDPDEIALKHIIDSIALATFINKKQIKVLDIGSGGGFPGFSLKIVNPELNIVMIDSVKKKVNFLKDLIRTTKMDNIDAIHTRAEELANQSLYAGSFDIVVSRAFASLEKFYTLAKPFLNKNGRILAMKGQIPDGEIKQVEMLQSFSDSKMSIKSTSYELPFKKIDRSIIEIS
jgi:16S rRNA (guanine527-N7)-methyltransferase